MSIQDGLKCIAKYCACSEIHFPYEMELFSCTPSISAVKAARTHISGFKYLSVSQDLIHIKQALFSGYPILVGIQLYTSFESDIVAKNGIVQLPDENEVNLGGHCVLIYGYSDITKTFTLANCWGTEWGQKGYFTLPYNDVLNPNFA